MSGNQTNASHVHTSRAAEVSFQWVEKSAAAIKKLKQYLDWRNKYCTDDVQPDEDS